MTEQRKPQKGDRVLAWGTVVEGWGYHNKTGCTVRFSDQGREVHVPLESIDKVAPTMVVGQTVMWCGDKNEVVFVDPEDPTMVVLRDLKSRQLYTVESPEIDVEVSE